MTSEQLRALLTQVQDNKVSVDQALALLEQETPVVRWDHDRVERRGFPESVLGSGKTLPQVIEALEAARHPLVLATRIPPEWEAPLLSSVPHARYYGLARMVVVGDFPPQREGPEVAILTGGTADQAVAEEALLTLRASGIPARMVSDVGVAGLHRLLSVLPDLAKARTLIAIAGMEGTLPGVLAGLTRVPVIGVPTSVGMGAHFGGLVPLFTMLNACAEGLAVVNVDNGFGAARLAQLIWQAGEHPPAPQSA